MSLYAAQQTTRSTSPTPSRNNEGNRPAESLRLDASGVNSKNRVRKPQWTAKRTRGQFSFYTGSAGSQARRQRPHTSNPSERSTQLANALLQHAITAGDAVNPADKSEQLAAGVQTAADDGTTDSLSRLHTNVACPQPSYRTSPTSFTDINMGDGVESRLVLALCNAASPDRGAAGVNGAASVPRSFAHVDLTVPSDDSDRDITRDSPTTRAEMAVMHDVPLDLSEAGGSAGVYSCGTAQATIKKEPLSTLKQLRSEFSVSATGESREVIYISSSDESEGEDDGACSPIRRLTLEESPFHTPTSELLPPSVEVDCQAAQAVIVVTTKQAIPDKAITINAIPDKAISSKANASKAIFFKASGSEASSGKATAKKAGTGKLADKTSTAKANAESESSEDNVPLAVLRRNRLKRRRLSDHDEQTEFAFVNRPTPRSKKPATMRKQPKNFDSSAFDAMIYAQSGIQPPTGVMVPRRALESTAPAQDPRVFVSANPAVHGMVVRSSKWWKDKAQEIRKRPNRKKWFGKAAERMRWLYRLKVEEETKRHEHSKSSAARQTRQDPQYATYQRIMDFGDIPEDQLPPDVLCDPAWVKACEWQRKMREADAVLRRQVEHSTQMTWQYYQDILEGTE